jgi:hypothetical protein
MTLDPIYSVAAIILCVFCLSYSVKNSLSIDRFVRPQLECLINHLQFSRLCSSLFLFVSSIHRQGKALMARSIVQRTPEEKWCCDCGVQIVLIESRIVLRDISTKSIVTPPDGRSGPPIHISGNQRLRYYRQAYPSLSV